MVRGVYIENFRSFRELTVDNLAPINIVVGKNNTGKSSFLEAVFLALDASPIIPSRSVYEYLLERRGLEVDPFSFYPAVYIHELAESLRIHFFHRNAERARIHLEMDNRKISHEFEFRLHLLAFSGKEDSEVSRFASLVDNGNPILELFFNLYGSAYFSLHEVRSAEGEDEGILKGFIEACGEDLLRSLKRLESVDSPEIYGSIKGILSPFFHAPVESFSPGIEDFYVNLADGTRIPLSMVGDGIRSFILHYMALGISPERKAYLFFEEPENYLHPGLLSALARAMVESPHQIFVATHNLDFLKRILYYAKEREKDIRVLAFRDLKEGIPEIRTYALEEAFTALNVLEMDLR